MSNQPSIIDLINCLDNVHRYMSSTFNQRGLGLYENLEFDTLLSLGAHKSFIQYELPIFLNDAPQHFNEVYKHYKEVCKVFPNAPRHLAVSSIRKLINNDPRFHVDGDTVSMNPQ